MHLHPYIRQCLSSVSKVEQFINSKTFPPKYAMYDIKHLSKLTRMPSLFLVMPKEHEWWNLNPNCSWIK